MTKKTYLLQKILIIVFAVFAVWFIIPIPAGIWNLGNMTGLAVSLLFMFCILFFYPLKAFICRRKWAKIVAGVLSGFIALCILFAMVTSVLMIAAAEKEPSQSATVVVLGCKVNGSTPSLMLARRAEAALEYLEAHPEAFCIAAGGQGSDENISEAEAIRQYLANHGIENSRIFLEDQSTNTEENLKNARTIIENSNLPKEIAVVSDYYHQFRASIIAGKQGMQVGSVPAETPLWLLPTYWVREWIGVLQEWLLKP